MGSETRVACSSDIETVQQIDSLQIGSSDRAETIRRSIQEGGGIVATVDGTVQGFLLHHDHFFGRRFIELIVVAKESRRRGLASLLIRHFEGTAGNGKIFTSTNRSNGIMQKVLAANGYVESGIVDNLDEGDPELIYFKNL